MASHVGAGPTSVRSTRWKAATDRGFFSGDYWSPSVAVGVRLSWNLFIGFQTRYRVQQNTIAVQRAEVQLGQAVPAAVLDVERALRNLASAQ